MGKLRSYYTGYLDSVKKQKKMILHNKKMYSDAMDNDEGVYLSQYDRFWAGPEEDDQIEFVVVKTEPAGSMNGGILSKDGVYECVQYVDWSGKLEKWKMWA